MNLSVGRKGYQLYPVKQTSSLQPAEEILSGSLHESDSEG
jgi:hypothetical protein